MDSISYFNVIGPIMIGPSSSHTAGAVRIANAARKIVDGGFNKIVFKLHGSFAKTYRGHGTDRALIAGCLGLEPDDERIKEAYELAEKENIEIVFEEINLLNAHPNTVKIHFHYPGGQLQKVTGISTGGGQFKIISINGSEVSLSGDHPALILEYPDRKGVIMEVSTMLAKNDYNIVTIKNEVQEEKVVLVMELNKKISDKLYQEIREGCCLTRASYIEF